jgi:hypothetical protein
LLADSADGCTEAIMVAHGFTVDMLVELINAGLATASADARSPADTRWRYPRADHGGGPAGARRTKRETPVSSTTSTHRDLWRSQVQKDAKGTAVGFPPLRIRAAMTPSWWYTP